MGKKNDITTSIMVRVYYYNNSENRYPERFLRRHAVFVVWELREFVHTIFKIIYIYICTHII